MINEKALVATDALYHIQKARVAAQVRLTHLAKPTEKYPKGRKCDLTKEIKERAGSVEDWLNHEVELHVKSHPAYPWFSQVKGVGNLNIGKITSFIDIEKATMISKLWRYAGFAPDAKGKAERQIAGQKLHYNKVLKAMCWRLAKAIIIAQGSKKNKIKGPYYEYYLEQKQAITANLMRKGYAIVPSLELPTEKDPRTGKMKHVEKDGFFGLGHVDTMAMRKMIKLFLSHLWVKWREAEGLSVTKPYVHAIKGHTDYRPPEDYIEAQL